jgi:hypothetical protein
MTITGAGKYSQTVLLSYADSVHRLEDYRSAARHPSAGTLIYGILLISLLPGLLWRLIAGRDPNPRKNAKSRVELSAV